jgi:hypothetical protein
MKLHLGLHENTVVAGLWACQGIIALDDNVRIM